MTAAARVFVGLGGLTAAATAEEPGADASLSYSIGGLSCRKKALNPRDSKTELQFSSADPLLA